MEQFKEDYLFNMFKDETIVTKEFKSKIKKYNLSCDDIKNIRARITKYQINKYGSTLDVSKKIDHLDIKKCHYNRQLKNKVINAYNAYQLREIEKRAEKRMRRNENS